MVEEEEAEGPRLMPRPWYKRPSVVVPIVGAILTALVGPLSVEWYRASRETKSPHITTSTSNPSTSNQPAPPAPPRPPTGTDQPVDLPTSSTTALRRGETARNELRRTSGLRGLEPEEADLLLSRVPFAVYGFAEVRNIK